MKLSANKLGVARADNADYGWRDGAVGAALCGKNRSVLLLADAADDSHATAFVKANSASVRQGYVFGGTAAVPKATYDRLVAASDRNAASASGKSAAPADAPVRTSPALGV